MDAARDIPEKGHARKTARILLVVAPVLGLTALAIGPIPGLPPEETVRAKLWPLLFMTSLGMAASGSILYFFPRQRFVQIIAVLGGVLTICGLVQTGIRVAHGETAARTFFYPGLFLLAGCAIKGQITAQLEKDAARKLRK